MTMKQMKHFLEPIQEGDNPEKRVEDLLWQVRYVPDIKELYAWINDPRNWEFEDMGRTDPQYGDDPDCYSDGWFSYKLKPFGDVVRYHEVCHRVSSGQTWEHVLYVWDYYDIKPATGKRTTPTWTSFEVEREYMPLLLTIEWSTMRWEWSTMFKALIAKYANRYSW